MHDQLNLDPTTVYFLLNIVLSLRPYHIRIIHGLLSGEAVTRELVFWTR